MNELIEIMARACCDCHLWKNAFDAETEGNQESWRWQAKTAVKALKDAGFRIVPVEPTMEMQNAAVDKTEFHYTHPQQTGIRESPQMFFKSAYKAMLEASPHAAKG